MPQPPLMVLEGNGRATLGVVRSLGRLGIPLYVGSDDRLPKSGLSRYATRRFGYPPKEAGIDAMHAAIIDRVRAWRPAVLMPVGGSEGWATVFAHYDEYTALTRVVASPSHEQYDRLDEDKVHLLDLAARHGVSCPRTFRPRTIEEALDLRGALPYPVIVKPPRGTGGVGVRKVEDARALAAALVQSVEVPIIQEFIAGEDVELTLLCTHGESLAGSVYRSLRTFPIPFGPSTACVTVRDDALMELGIRFLRKLSYHGVAHMDFRRDPHDGQAKLLDFNPGLTGTNDVSLASGVNFALMLYRIALGQPVEPQFTYAVGLEYRWLLYGEVLHLLTSPHKGQVLPLMLRGGQIRTNVQLTDPLPHVTEGITLIRRHFSRWWGRRTRTRRAARQAADLT